MILNSWVKDLHTNVTTTLNECWNNRIDVIFCLFDGWLVGQQSFTDLAEMVAKVRGPTNKKYEDSDSEEGNDEEYLSEHDGESTALRYRNRASGSNFAE